MCSPPPASDVAWVKNPLPPTPTVCTSVLLVMVELLPSWP